LYLKSPDSVWNGNAPRHKPQTTNHTDNNNEATNQPLCLTDDILNMNGETLKRPPRLVPRLAEPYTKHDLKYGHSYPKQTS
jgi:hypothetical protein